MQISTTKSDTIGAFASFLCLIHCIVTPMIFIVKPIIDGAVDAHDHEHHGYWWILDYVFLSISFLAVYYSSKHTSKEINKTVLWISWVVFAIGILSELVHFEHGIWFTSVGSIALVITHILNYRYCKSCNI